MTQEEKDLLFEDLCARLPYGVICKMTIKYASITEILEFGGLEEFYNGTMDVKPYLRPMSSMTEEEEELMKGSVICFDELEGNCSLFDGEGLDWLLANHFDFRGLIEKGLALEAPEDMYSIQ